VGLELRNKVTKNILFPVTVLGSAPKSFRFPGVWSRAGNKYKDEVPCSGVRFYLPNFKKI